MKISSSTLAIIRFFLFSKLMVPSSLFIRSKKSNNSCNNNTTKIEKCCRLQWLVNGNSTPCPKYCTHHKSNQNAIEVGDEACWVSYGKGHGHQLPPAMPSLVRNANGSYCLPYIFQKISREDGSIVIKKMEGKKHDHLNAREENKRFNMQSIGFDQDRLPNNSSKNLETCDENNENVPPVKSNLKTKNIEVGDYETFSQAMSSYKNAPTVSIGVKCANEENMLEKMVAGRMEPVSMCWLN